MLQQGAGNAYLPLFQQSGFGPKPTPIKVTIRDYQPGDKLSVMKIVQSGFLEQAPYVKEQSAIQEYLDKNLEPYLKKIAASPRNRFNRRFWVAEYEGSVIGCVGVQPCPNAKVTDKNGISLCLMAVDKKFRSRHVGRQLIAQVQNHCLQHSIVNLHLAVPEFAHSLRAFFEPFGFKATGKKSAFNLNWLEFSAQPIKPQHELKKKKKRRKKRTAHAGRH